MAFINNKKFNEIMKAGKNNDEKALLVLQAYRNGDSQDNIDRLVNDFYAVPSAEPTVVEPEEAPEMEIETPQVEVEEGDVVKPICDISDVLNKECEGLFDENEIEDITFGDYLANKKRDNNRARKNLEYFSGFDLGGRESYVSNKKEAYKNKFDNNVKDIERKFNDYNKSIDGYIQGVTDTLDDDVELDMNQADLSYNDIVDNENVMHSFGRYWDEEDNNSVIEILKALCEKYGKKNVLAALNVLKADNENFKNYKNGQINQEVERYGKALDKALIK